MSGNNKEDQISEAKSLVQNNAAKLSGAAKIIHDLIPPGGTATIQWEKMPTIMTPGSEPEIHTLIVTKPLVNLSANFKVK